MLDCRSRPSRLRVTWADHRQDAHRETGALLRRPNVNYDDVQGWLDAYVEAWRTYDPDAIGTLFAQEATYAYHPYDRG